MYSHVTIQVSNMFGSINVHAAVLFERPCTLNVFFHPFLYMASLFTVYLLVVVRYIVVVV